MSSQSPLARVSIRTIMPQARKLMIAVKRLPLGKRLLVYDSFFFMNGDYLVGGDIGELLFRAGRPGYGEEVYFGGGTETERYGELTLGAVAGAAPEHPPLGVLVQVAICG